MTLTVDSLLPPVLPWGWPTEPTLLVAVLVLLVLIALAGVQRHARRRAKERCIDLARLEATDAEARRQESLARFTAPPSARPGAQPGDGADVRARDSLAALMGQNAAGESPSHERRASGTPGWPAMDGVQRAASPASPSSPSPAVPERTPDAFSSHPQDRNLHRRRWLERNAEIIRRLDEAHHKAGASQATLNTIEQERDASEATAKGRTPTTDPDHPKE